MNRKTFLRGLTASAFVVPTSGGLAWAQDAGPEVIEMVMGAEDAPVTLIEYASYTCPHCASFHKTVFPKLKEEFIDTGKIKFVFREVYFDRIGLWAGMIARCEGPEKYFGVSDLLLSRQSEWARGDDAATIAENLYKIGRVAGMNDDAMKACLQDRAKAEALVAEFQKTTEADGVSATPTLVLNGVNIGNVSYADLSSQINDALG